jgi:hypothetical protein
MSSQAPDQANHHGEMHEIVNISGAYVRQEAKVLAIF